MDERETLPLILVQVARQIWGKTRFQKLFFLAQAQFADRFKGRPLPFTFTLHHYGPFSFDLARTMELLCARGLLQERLERTSTGNPVFHYELTSQGSAHVETELRGHPTLEAWRAVLSDAVREHASLDLPSLVEQAYEAAGQKPGIISIRNH